MSNVIPTPLEAHHSQEHPPLPLPPRALPVKVLVAGVGVLDARSGLGLDRGLRRQQRRLLQLQHEARDDVRAVLVPLELEGRHGPQQVLLEAARARRRQAKTNGKKAGGVQSYAGNRKGRAVRSTIRTSLISVYVLLATYKRGKAAQRKAAQRKAAQRDDDLISQA